MRAFSSDLSWTAEELASTPYDRGKQHFNAGRYGLAVKHFEKALAQDSDSVEALNGLAAAFDRLQRFEQAERFYLRALYVDPENSQTMNNLGYSYLIQKRYDLALSFLRNAEVLDPENSLILENVQQAEAGLDLDTQAFVASTVDSEQHESLSTAPKSTIVHTGLGAPEASETVSLPAKVEIRRVSSGTSAWIERTSPTVQTLITQPTPEVLTAMRDVNLPARIANFRNLAAVTKLQTQPAPWEMTHLLIAESVVQRDLSGSVGRDLLVGDPVSTPSPAPTISVQVADLLPLPGADTVEAHFPALADLQQLSAAVFDVPIAETEVETPQEADQSSAPPQADEVSVQQAALPLRHRSSGRRLPPALPSGDEMPVIEVSNGAGRLQMAFRIGGFLEKKGVDVGRLTNADHFSHQETVIYYQTKWLQKAQQLAALLPAEVELEAAPNQRSDVRIRLGGDLLKFDQGLFYANRESPDEPTS